MTVSALSYQQLYSTCDLDFLSFETTRDLEDLNQPLGQEQAINAINFGISVDSYGYNLFCIGPEGTGKASLVRQILGKAAKKCKTPNDWCYVYNFKTPYKPAAIRMPAGKAKIFAKAVDKLIGEIRVALPAVFDGDEYKTQLKAIEDAFRDQKTKYFDDIQKHTTGKNVSVLRMPVGLVVAPTKDGDVLSPEAFEKLSEEEQQEVLAELNAAQEELEHAVHDIPKWEKEQREQIEQLNEKFASLAIKHLIDDLKRKYRRNKSVTTFLRNMYDDIIENVDLFLEDEEEQAQPPADEEQPLPVLPKQKTDGALRRYKVNVLIDHTDRNGAPLIFLDHPILTNLIGRIDRQQQYGALITDFNMIKAGALHEANGGFLVIEAKDLLNQTSSWEALKRALRSKKITMDPPSSDGMMTTILEPEAIPLNVKVVLLGEPELYYMLAENDPDFMELFKVEANFFPYMEKTQENISKYARLIATQARRNKLRPLQKDAVARLIEHASRLAEDSQKLSRQLNKLAIFGTKSVQIPADKKGLLSGGKGGFADAVYYHRLAKDLQARRNFSVETKGYQLLLAEGYYHRPVLTKDIHFLKDEKFKEKSLMGVSYFLDSGIFAQRNIQDQQVPGADEVLYDSDIGIDDETELNEYVDIVYDQALGKVQEAPDKTTALMEDISNKWQSSESGPVSAASGKDWWLEEDAFERENYKNNGNPFEKK